MVGRREVVVVVAGGACSTSYEIRRETNEPFAFRWRGNNSLAAAPVNQQAAHTEREWHSSGVSERTEG